MSCDSADRLLSKIKNGTIRTFINAKYLILKQLPKFGWLFSFYSYLSNCMSKIIATILVLFLGFSSVYSQKLTPKYQLGLKMGVTGHKARFNFPEDEALYDQKYQFGYQIGGVLDLPLANIFHFYSELYYVRKGKETLITSSGLTIILTSLPA